MKLVCSASGYEPRYLAEEGMPSPVLFDDGVSTSQYVSLHGRMTDSEGNGSDTVTILSQHFHAATDKDKRK
jgi:hypothetical protein